MDSTTSEQARINARLPKEQKQFLEKAAYLGGFRNLTDFIFQAAQEKANEIIQEKEPDIASEMPKHLLKQLRILNLHLIILKRH
jgi:uncharacterized protein (DUF1778 family)